MAAEASTYPDHAGGGSAKRRNQTRLSVNINDSTAAALRNYVDLHGVSITEAVRRLVSYGALVSDAADAGKSVQLRDGDEVERLVLIDSLPQHAAN
jgi:hypothetical protein